LPGRSADVRRGTRALSPPPGGCGVEVERLGVDVAGEGEHRFARHREAAELADVAGREVLPPPPRGRGAARAAHLRRAWRRQGAGQR
jgi:hypothetical protein